MCELLKPYELKLRKSEMYKERFENLYNNHNQDKIELLEKVKDLLLIETKEHPIVYDITRDIVGGAIDKDKCFAIIDTLISEIKGE